MNLSLIDPFVLAQDYPDTLTEKISMLSRATKPLVEANKYRKWACDMFALQSQGRLPGLRTS